MHSLFDRSIRSFGLCLLMFFTVKQSFAATQEQCLSIGGFLPAGETVCACPSWGDPRVMLRVSYPPGPCPSPGSEWIGRRREEISTRDRARNLDDAKLRVALGVGYEGSRGTVADEYGGVYTDEATRARETTMVTANSPQVTVAFAGLEHRYPHSTSPEFEEFALAALEVVVRGFEVPVIQPRPGLGFFARWTEKSRVKKLNQQIEAKKQAALRFLARVRAGEFRDRADVLEIGLTIGQVLGLAFAATTDRDLYPTEEDRTQKMWGFIEGMANIQKAHSGDRHPTGQIDWCDPRDQVSCLTGTYIRLLEHLDRVHPDVSLARITHEIFTGIIQEVGRSRFPAYSRGLLVGLQEVCEKIGLPPTPAQLAAFQAVLRAFNANSGTPSYLESLGLIVSEPRLQSEIARGTNLVPSLCASVDAFLELPVPGVTALCAPPLPVLPPSSQALSLWGSIRGMLFCSGGGCRRRNRVSPEDSYVVPVAAAAALPAVDPFAARLHDLMGIYNAALAQPAAWAALVPALPMGDGEPVRVRPAAAAASHSSTSFRY